DYRVVRMDLPGFGLTGHLPQNQYEIADDIAFLNAFTRELDIEQAHFVGSSLGGRIVWEYGLQHPEQVITLTLINALGYPQESWPPGIEMAQWPVIDKIMEHVTPRFIFEDGLKEVYFDPQLVDAVL
ncbi:alpha/beta fold hydrolase, partial [Vibrio campbellii]